MVEKGVKKRCFCEKSHKTARVAERVGFEPTCPFTDNRISSAARYDHFDTAPCINFVLVSRFLERHSGENRFPPLLRRTPEALILLHFLTVSFLLKPVISSQARYDHFDTAPQSMHYTCRRGKIKPFARCVGVYIMATFV